MTQDKFYRLYSHAHLKLRKNCMKYKNCCYLYVSKLYSLYITYLYKNALFPAGIPWDPVSNFSLGSRYITCISQIFNSPSVRPNPIPGTNKEFCRRRRNAGPLLQQSSRCTPQNFSDPIVLSQAPNSADTLQDLTGHSHLRSS